MCDSGAAIVVDAGYFLNNVGAMRILPNNYMSL